MSEPLSDEMASALLERVRDIWDGMDLDALGVLIEALREGKEVVVRRKEEGGLEIWAR